MEYNRTETDGERNIGEGIARLNSRILRKPARRSNEGSGQITAAETNQHKLVNSQHTQRAFESGFVEN